MERHFQVQCKVNLPALDKWICPVYFGVGDLIVKLSIESSKPQIHDPRTWKRDFPAFNYQWLVLANTNSPWSDEALQTRMHGICERLISIKPTKSTKSTKSTRCTCLHIVDQSCVSLFTVNHYVREHNIDWEWYAMSPFESDMERCDGNWLRGADGDGDISSCANIAFIQSEFPNGVDMIVTDVNAQQLSQVLIVLKTLAKGKSAVILKFELLDSHSISLLWILHYCFQEVIFYPNSGSSASLVLQRYKYNVSGAEIDRLMCIQRYIADISDSSLPAIFARSDIPATFVQQIHRALIV